MNNYRSVPSQDVQPAPYYNPAVLTDPGFVAQSDGSIWYVYADGRAVPATPAGRDQQISGASALLWILVLFLVILPALGALIYVIASY